MQCSPYQEVSGEIYHLKQHFLPPATTWSFTQIKDELLKNTQVVFWSNSHMPQGSLQTSSPIWASEASLARMHEQVAKPRGAEERRACNDLS